MAAVTPNVQPLTIPQIVTAANVGVKGTLKDYPGAVFKVSGCHKTAPHYGVCYFYVVVPPTAPQQHGLQKCTGFVDVRNIGHGIERRFRILGCKAV